MDYSLFLFISFLVAVSIQILYYSLLYSKFAFYKPPLNDIKDIPISVIICAKNEEDNLRRLIPLLLDQNYRNYELVLINDASSDRSLKIMKKASDSHKNVKVVDVKQVEKFYGNKKYALTLGIKAASNNFLLFTDADCIPSSKNWIREMSAAFTKNHHIVLGYGGYAKIKGSFLNKLIRFETMVTAMQYISMALIKLPYMGVGRNMAYKKNLFFDNNGFIKHMHIKSGDDDLFINSVSNSQNTTICIKPEAFTISKPKTSFGEWIRQKRRHITTASHYKMAHKSILALFYTSQIVFYTLATALILLNFKVVTVLILIGLKLILQFTIYGKIASKLNEKDLLLYVPFLEIFLIVFQFYIFMRNIISKPKRWN